MDITSIFRTIDEINGSIDRGGWMATLSALRDTDVVEQNQRIDITWAPALGSNPPSGYRSALSGYVNLLRKTADRVGSQLDINIRTTDGFIEDDWLQGISFAETDARANYHEFSDDATECPAEDMGHTLTMGKIVKHILGYYDTCADLGPNYVAHTNHVFHPTRNPTGWISLDHVEDSEWSPANTGGSMGVSIYIVRETDNLWSRLQEIAVNEFFSIYFDKTDTLHYHRHPMYETVLPDPVMTFDESFLLTPIEVIPRYKDRVRQVKLHAVTDRGSTIHANYPSSPTYVYGRVEDRDRIRCNSQATLDDWAERLYKFLNRDYTVQWEAPGCCGLLFELLDRVQITYVGTAANGLDINWSEKKFWVHDISVRPNAGFSGTTTFTLEAENA